MKEKMKQNKKYLAVFCAIFIFVASISMPSFAYSSTSINGVDFSDQPVVHGTYTNVLGSGTPVYGSWVRYCCSGSSNVYCFVAGAPSSSYKDIVFVSQSNDATATLYYFDNNDTSGTPSLLTNGPLTNTSVGFYYMTYTVQATESTIVAPWFNSLNEGMAALQDWIDNPPSSGSSYSLNISLPAGNILIAQTGGISNNHYYLETTGGTTGATVKPGLNNIQTGYYNTLPISFTLPSNSLSYPPYWAGTGKQSIFGTYNRQAYGSTVDSSYTYFVVGNPMYPNDNSAEGGRLNAALNVQIDNVITYKVIDLKTGYVSGTLTGTNDGSSYIDYHYDENSGQWVGINQNGVEADPVLGGQNDYMNTPSTVNDWLENIAHQISNFFTGAIGAASTLINAGKDFFNVLTGLYSWLPPAVFSVLSSALIIIITIGVIKAFI